MDALFQLIDRLLPRRLQVKLSLLVTILLMMLVSLIGALFSDFSERTLREQLGRKASPPARGRGLKHLSTAPTC